MAFKLGDYNLSLAAATIAVNQLDHDAEELSLYERGYLVLLSQKVAFWALGILDNFGRFVFRHEELRWITQ